MKNLLKFELHNMLRQKMIYVFAAVMLVLLTLMNQTSDARLEYYQSIGYGAEDMIVGALSSCFFTYFLAGIIPFIACRDYEQGVIKNVYAKGFSREKVYSAKFLFVMIVSAILAIITILVGYVEAIIVFGNEETHVGVIMTAQFVSILAYTAFYMLFCQLFRKSGFAVAFLLLVPPIGGLLLDIIDSSLNIRFSFGDLWITQTMAYIHGGTISDKEIILSFVTSAIYIVGCYFLGRKLQHEGKWRKN